MFVFDFMSMYNWGKKRYGKRWAKKIIWQGKFNGCEVVEVNEDKVFYKLAHNKTPWLFFYQEHVKEVRDV